MRRTPNSLRTAAYLCGILAAAEVLLRAGSIPQYYFPTPLVVLEEIVRLFPTLVHHLGITLGEALLGFILGNSLAVLFGALFCLVRSFREALYPLLVALQAVPIVAVAPFITIWFGPGLLGKVILAALICYFPAVVISTNGFMSINRDALALLNSAGASKRQIFWHLQVPSAIPAIVAALEVSATLSTIGAVVAELAGANQGIGYLIVRASYEFRTPTLFAALTAISVATLILFNLVHYVGERFATRYRFSYATALD